MIDIDIEFHDDYIEVHDIDETDEKELRQLVAACSDLAKMPHPIKVGVLSDQQWHRQLDRMLDPQLRQSFGPYMHVIGDPDNPRQLLVGPSCVSGINAKQQSIVTEVAYAAFMCGRALPVHWANGVTELFVRKLAEERGTPLRARSFIREAAFVEAMISVLIASHGHNAHEWMVEIKHRPKNVLSFLAKSPYAVPWPKAIKDHPQIGPYAHTLKGPRDAFLRCHWQPPAHLRDEIIDLSVQQAAASAAEAATATASSKKPPKESK